jgi:divalent metal cation (Fe/Co/Zn/Cd) transporter
MSRVDLACLGMVILGFVLFLYGANVYDAIIGWVGVYLMIGGILVFLLFYIYNELTKKVEVQNP